MSSRTIVAFITSSTFFVAAGIPAATPRGKAFPSPDAAAQALVTAAKAGDVRTLIEILGPSGKDIVSTGDPVADRKARQDFVARAGQKMKLVPFRGQQNKKTLVVGQDDWPTPIPIVKLGQNWYFDTSAGKEEILNRRIGSNELDAIEVSRGYVEAQNNFGEANQRTEGAPIYAQKVFSSPGQHDGLYWPAEPGDAESPMDDMIAKAFAEGYINRCEPYHGYYFKIVTTQGPNAPGGEMNYIDGDAMTRGYAMIAWPASYGATGVMTFLVSKTGIVYQKNLGPDTASVASGYTAYNPDSTWTPVGETGSSR